MRVYLEENEATPVRVICNRCQKELEVENGIVKEGCFSADTVFGYFSKKDGERHRFDLCEDCYEKIAAEFEIPVEKIEIKEFL